ncbi:hypothetical protein Poly51_39760 [Rubripirellula tenax]|uniref:Uncharacterized protein n=1 Tax=Rubripirellula tenax TaxID=2528015 RepID=A0A5C6ELS3_9BACT|nr:hypothetical protein [Rubripirellula tenax]TWU50683.1 hypothetical protein Poly51_39760 [Rubripirellula tenax]
MGTHIDVLFARDTSLSIDALNTRLNNTFKQLQPDLNVLAATAFHSRDTATWDLSHFPRDGSEPEYIFAEGPHGFDVNIYTHVATLGSAFRFRHLHAPESQVAKPLQNIVHAVARNLSGNLTFIAVAGGMGGSDHVLDHVYYNNGDIDSAAQLLIEQHGDPCGCWDDLNGDSNGWLFCDSRVR